MTSVEFSNLSEEEQVATLEPLLGHITDRYPFEVADTELLYHGFNTTFRIATTAGEKFALRINVNSDRTLNNLAAEIFFVQSIVGVKTARPVAMSDGNYVGTVWHDASLRDLHFVLYEWLNGVELADDTNETNLFASGVLMAKLHAQTTGLVLPEGAELPILTDAMWGLESYLTESNPMLTAEEVEMMNLALGKANEVYAAQIERGKPQLIHADLHGSNLMWDAETGEVAVFDFDDCAIGTPLQDLATALYYFEPAEREHWLAGYQSVSPLPEYTDAEWDTLMIQRRLFLLNYVFETSDPKAKAILPQYLKETVRRLRVYLNRPAALPKGLSQYANEHGRIVRLPVKLGKKMELALWLLELLQPNFPYSEAELNLIFDSYVDDFALMRRMLVEAGHLERDRYGYEYRRVIKAS